MTHVGSNKRPVPSVKRWDIAIMREDGRKRVGGGDGKEKDEKRWGGKRKG